MSGQPRADEFARLKVRLSALAARWQDEAAAARALPPGDENRGRRSQAWAFDDCARSLGRLLEETALAAQQSQPAPELRAAMAESRRYREQLTDLAESLEAGANAVRPGPDARAALRTAGRLRKILEGK